MPAATGAGGNGLRVAEIENVEIAATGTDPMAAQYPGAHSTHTCGLYLAQWPQWSEFRNIDIRGLNTGIAIPALPVTAPAGLNADSNRWQNITIQATHAFTAAAGSNNVLDNVVAMAGQFGGDGEPPTGLVLDLTGTQQGWTVRNAVVLPSWNAVQPQLTVTAAGGAVTGGDGGFGTGIGIRSVWDAGSADVQRELHSAGDGDRERERVDWDDQRDAGRGGLLGDDDGERERGGDLGYGGAGEPDRRAEHDVLARKPAEGQRRLHGVERGGIGKLRNAVGRRRRDAAGRRQLCGAGGQQPAGDDLPGGPVSGRGLRGQAAGLRGCGEHAVWRRLRCAELYRDPVDGVEPDDIDGEYDGATAVRDDRDGQPGDRDGRDAERGAARVRAAGCQFRQPAAWVERCSCTRGRAAMVQVGDPTYATDTRASTWTTR